MKTSRKRSQPSIIDPMDPAIQRLETMSPQERGKLIDRLLKESPAPTGQSSTSRPAARSQPEMPSTKFARSAESLRQELKEAYPHLSDSEIQEMLDRF
jgi:hypothetical protein